MIGDRLPLATRIRDQNNHFGKSLHAAKPTIIPPKKEIRLRAVNSGGAVSARTVGTSGAGGVAASGSGDRRAFSSLAVLVPHQHGITGRGVGIIGGRGRIVSSADCVGDQEGRVEGSGLAQRVRMRIARFVMSMGSIAKF